MLLPLRLCCRYVIKHGPDSSCSARKLALSVYETFVGRTWKDHTVPKQLVLYIVCETKWLCWGVISIKQSGKFRRIWLSIYTFCSWSLNDRLEEYWVSACPTWVTSVHVNRSPRNHIIHTQLFGFDCCNFQYVRKCGFPFPAGPRTSTSDDNCKPFVRFAKGQESATSDYCPFWASNCRGESCLASTSI